MAAAGLTLLSVVVAGLVGTSRPGTAGTELVEGRVAVRVPAGWPVRRVTDGPGSARVEVISPEDPGNILHIVESPAPTTDLVSAAEALRRTVADQPAGVFVDFNPDDRRSGRPAVTYRERRSGHDIWWTVVIAGRVRIAIGCQSGSQRRTDIEAACEQAIGSAREIS